MYPCYGYFRAVTIQGFLVPVHFAFEVTDIVVVLKPVTLIILPIFILSEQSQSKCTLVQISIKVFAK